MIDPLSRRAFLAKSSGAIAALAVGRRALGASPRAEPPGPVYGRVGPRGLAGGSSVAPSSGEVILIDGRVLRASHVGPRGIGAGKSVLLAPEGDRGWSVLYAEV